MNLSAPTVIQRPLFAERDGLTIGVTICGPLDVDPDTVPRRTNEEAGAILLDEFTTEAKRLASLPSEHWLPRIIEYGSGLASEPGWRRVATAIVAGDLPQSPERSSHCIWQAFRAVAACRAVDLGCDRDQRPFDLAVARIYTAG